MRGHYILGQTTAILVHASDDAVEGASVGDSEAWFIADGKTESLTAHQQRKPLVGTGRATPVPFSLSHRRGTLLVGTDGLFKYAKPDAVVAAVLLPDVSTAVLRLVDAARLPNRSLQDDVAVAVVRC